MARKTIIKCVWVDCSGSLGRGPAQHTCTLPTGADRWEIMIEQERLKLIAVYADGSVAQIREYARGSWAHYVTEPMT